MQLAIASIFIVLAVSFLGSVFPVVGRKWSHISGIAFTIKLLAFAGTGVILAAGFIHLLSHANEYLSSPCLPEGWVDAYHPGFAYLFCLISIMIMMVMDFYMDLIFGDHAGHGVGVLSNPSDSIDLSETLPSAIMGACTKHSDSNSGSDFEQEHDNAIDLEIEEDRGDGRNFHDPNVSLRALITSEASVAVHSVLIGLALGTTGKGEFPSLLIAIVFHQLLEGLAMGVIAVRTHLNNTWIILLALFYSLTTPIGIAIGIGVRKSMNPNSQASLMTQGILDAIAAGLLIYVALGDHINAIKCYGPWLKTQSWRVMALCMTAFLTGGGIISLLGAWD